jgi:hypothetical protein
MANEPGALTIAELQDAEVEALIGLWERCGLTRPWNDPRADIVLAQRGPNSIILVGKADGALCATVMVGHDGHRGWLYYLAVEPQQQGRGLGSRITRAAEEWLKLRGIRKVELMVRPENDKVQGFYASLGYTVEPRVLMTKWLDGREPTP